MEEEDVPGGSQDAFDEAIRIAYETNTLGACDLTVKLNGAGGTEVGLHKNVFVLASPVFEKMVEAEGTDVVYLTMPPEVFQIVRHYVYTRQLLEKLEDMELEAAIDLLKVTVNYDIRDLLTLVVNLIKGTLRLENVIKVWKLATELEVEQLEEFTLQTICQHPLELFKTTGFCNLDSKHVSRIFSNDDLACSEMDVLEAAMRWAIIKSNYSRDAIRHYFKCVLSCVRFRFVTPSQLAVFLLDVPSNILDDTYFLKVFQYISLPEDLREGLSLQFESKPRNYDKQRESEVEEGNEDMLVEETNAIESVDDATRASFQSSSSEMEATQPQPEKNPDNLEVPMETVDGTSGDDEDLFFRDITVESRTFSSYENLLHRVCHRDKDPRSIKSYQILDATIEHNYRPVDVRSLKSIVLDATCKFLSAEDLTPFINFVRYFDPMRYLVFNSSAEEGRHLNMEDVWSLEQNILLKFNGVTFLKINPSSREVVFNYVRDAMRLLSDDSIHLRKLSMSNCELDLKSLASRGGEMESLHLYRVWGAYSICEILKAFPNLKEFACWKFIPGGEGWSHSESFVAPPSLTFSSKSFPKDTMKKLVLNSTEIKVEDKHLPSTIISELRLEACTCSKLDHLCTIFPRIFPNLERLMISEWTDGNLAVAKLINSVKKRISTLHWIRIFGLKWSLLGTKEERELNKFLEELGLPTKCTNFLLEKTDNENSSWKGTSYEGRDTESPNIDGGFWAMMDEQEYLWYNLYEFYDDVEKYQDYFINRDDFPATMFWC